METMTIGSALSGLSLALFTGASVVFLVAVFVLATGVIVLAFLWTARLLARSIAETAVMPKVPATLFSVAKRKVVKEGAK